MSHRRKAPRNGSFKAASEAGHLKGIRGGSERGRRAGGGERHYIPKVNPQTSSSDPESRPIAHSLKERDKTGEEGRKREGKIKRRGRGRGGEGRRGGRGGRGRRAKGPHRHPKSRQAQTEPSPKNQEQILTLCK